MSDQRYTDALLANGRLREERDRLRALLDEADGVEAENDRLREERDRLREALKKIAAEDFTIEDDGTVRIPGPFAKIARTALAKAV